MGYFLINRYFSYSDNIKFLRALKQHYKMDHQDLEQKPKENQLSFKQNRYIYGQVTFKPGTTRKQVCSIINEQDMKCLRQKQLNIFFADREFINLFNRMQSCRFTTISSRANKVNQLQWTVLAQVRFEKLRNLDLCENQITNIECLVALNAPNIERLAFYHNKISNTSKVLNKFTFKRLQSISLSTNPISSVDIGRCKASFRPSEFTQIDFGESIFLNQGINFIAKTDHRHCKRLVTAVQMKITPTEIYQIPTRYQIIQITALKALKHKYSNQ